MPRRSILPRQHLLSCNVFTSMTDARWNRSRGRSTPQRQWSGGGWRWLRSRSSREHPGSTASSWTRSWSPSCTKSGEWGAAEIAASLDVGLQLVLRTLHDHGVPVRRGGSPPRTPSRATIDPRLTALYADPEITTMLRRHSIPRREQPGSITDGSPTPPRPRSGFCARRTLRSVSRQRISSSSQVNRPNASWVCCTLVRCRYVPPGPSHRGICGTAHKRRAADPQAVAADPVGGGQAGATKYPVAGGGVGRHGVGTAGRRGIGDEWWSPARPEISSGASRWLSARPGHPGVRGSRAAATARR